MTSMTSRLLTRPAPRRGAVGYPTRFGGRLGKTPLAVGVNPRNSRAVWGSARYPRHRELGSSVAPERALDVVGVDLQTRIVEEESQLLLPLERVVDGLREWAGWQQQRAVALLSQVREQLVDDGFRQVLSGVQALLGRCFLAALLDFVQLLRPCVRG